MKCRSLQDKSMKKTLAVKMKATRETKAYAKLQAAKQARLEQ